MTPSSPKDKNKKSAAAAGFPMAGVDVDQLERLLEFMTAHGLEEFEYEHAGLHIRLRKAAAQGSVASSKAAKAEAAATAMETASGSSAESESGELEAVAAPASSATKKAEELHIVKSPIVGTFYAASSPEATPFVGIGDVVQEGKVICIIEAMKLMNEIESDVGGEIVRILAENGQPVEYGQALFAIRPAVSSASKKK
jgi:acetyl-CoA carboxylase biotin carboxyl carrier protein